MESDLQLALLRGFVSELDRAVAHTILIMRAGNGAARSRTTIQFARAWAKAEIAILANASEKRRQRADDAPR